MMRLRQALTPKSGAVRDRVLRGAGLVLITLLLITITQIPYSAKSFATLQPTTPQTSQQTPQQTQPTRSGATTTDHARMNESRAQTITAANRHMVYLHKPDILITTMAKAGSSSLWHWLYKGVTGSARWSNTECTVHVHEKRSPCWQGHASYLFTLPAMEQVRILTDDKVLRVAIQRAPFERLISAFKSKFTCEDDLYKTDVHERDSMVKGLRKAAGRPGGNCLNVSEFADLLEACRNNVGHPGYPGSLSELDDHIRPQQFHFDEIDYDMILDVSHLSDIRVLQPVLKRLPFKDMCADGIAHRHSSGESLLSIPEDAAAKLYAFALVSKPGALRFVKGAEPSVSAAGETL